MSAILKSIIDAKKTECAAAQTRIPEQMLEALAQAQGPSRKLGQALQKKTAGQLNIIAECKERSPDRGILSTSQRYDPGSLAATYQRAGAVAVSVHTDKIFYGGELKHLREARDLCDRAIIRHDFIIDPYQIIESRAFGADSLVLYAGLLGDHAKLQYFIEIAREYDMEAIVVCRNEEEICDLALRSDAELIAIDSRRQASGALDLDLAASLFRRFAKDKKEAKKEAKSPREWIYLSGVRGEDDVKLMHSVGFQHFMLGEALMLHPEPESFIRALARPALR